MRRKFRVKLHHLLLTDFFLLRTTSLHVSNLHDLQDIYRRISLTCWPYQASSVGCWPPSSYCSLLSNFRTIDFVWRSRNWKSPPAPMTPCPPLLTALRPASGRWRKAKFGVYAISLGHDGGESPLARARGQVWQTGFPSLPSMFLQVPILSIFQLARIERMDGWVNWMSTAKVSNPGQQIRG